MMNPAVMRRQQKAEELLKSVGHGQPDTSMTITEGSAALRGKPTWNYTTPSRPFYQDLSRPIEEKIGMSYAWVRTDKRPTSKSKKPPLTRSDAFDDGEDAN